MEIIYSGAGTDLHSKIKHSYHISGVTTGSDPYFHSSGQHHFLLLRGNFFLFSPPLGGGGVYKGMLECRRHPYTTSILAVAFKGYL